MTWKPACLTCASMGLATSLHRMLGRSVRIAIRSAPSVASMSCRSSDATSPTGHVTAASAHQPSYRTPTSIETMSPARSFRGPGMPCTISWLTDTQVAAGKGSVPGTRWPLKSCSPPWEEMTSSTTVSISAVVTPAPTTAAAASWASRTIEPAVRISSI